RRPEFHWYASAEYMGRNNSVEVVGIARELTLSAKNFGENEFHALRTLDACDFRINEVEDGQVWITNSFPSSDDSRFQEAAHQKGIEVLVAIARNAKTAPDAK